MTTIAMKSVESSNINSIGYDAESQTLAVRFKDKEGGAGKLYRYANVPPEVYAEMSEAESVGRFFAVAVRGKFEVIKDEAEG